MQRIGTHCPNYFPPFLSSSYFSCSWSYSCFFLIFCPFEFKNNKISQLSNFIKKTFWIFLIASLILILTLTWTSSPSSRRMSARLASPQCSKSIRIEKPRYRCQSSWFRTPRIADKRNHTTDSCWWLQGQGAWCCWKWSCFFLVLCSGKQNIFAPDHHLPNYHIALHIFSIC